MYLFLPFQGGVGWYIPIGGETKPWRKPLREQQANAVRQEPWQPKHIHPADWKSIMNNNVLTSTTEKTEAKYITRDTKFDLNPDGNRMGKTLGQDSDGSSDEENYEPKPFTRMTLQVCAC